MRIVLFVLILSLILLSGCIKYIVPECKDCPSPSPDCEGKIIYRDELRVHCSCSVPYCVGEDVPEDPEAICTKDSDCVISGCSGQICAPEPVTTTCEFREAYACLRETTCGCDGGICAWDKDDQKYRECLARI